MEFTDANFEAEVIKSDIPVLVDFWANWCGPCKMISPMIDRIAAVYAGKLKVGKMDVDANSASPSSLAVRSLPTLMLFKGGKMADQIIGLVSEVQLKKAIDKVLG